MKHLFNFKDEEDKQKENGFRKNRELLKKREREVWKILEFHRFTLALVKVIWLLSTKFSWNLLRIPLKIYVILYKRSKRLSSTNIFIHSVILVHKRRKPAKLPTVFHQLGIFNQSTSTTQLVNVDPILVTLQRVFTYQQISRNDRSTLRNDRNLCRYMSRKREKMQEL